MVRRPLETMSQGRRCVTASAGGTISSLDLRPHTAAKSELRRTLRRLRCNLSRAVRGGCARQAARRLLRSRRLLQARHIAVYLSVGCELSTVPLIAALRRRRWTLWVPAVGREGRMWFVRLGSGRRLRRDRSGMPAPAHARVRRSARRLALIVMPVLGFDCAGHRLGSGRGYYDRALAGCAPGRPWRLGYAYAAQEVAGIPADPWDITLDAVATERGMRQLDRPRLHNTFYR